VSRDDRNWSIGHLVIWSVIWSVIWLVVWSGVVLGASGIATQGSQPASAPSVRTSLDRTAVWIADRVAYRVDIVCPRGIDILDDDMSKDKLKLDGFELVTSETGRSVDASDTTTHTFTFVLATYRVDVPALKVGAMSVRYYVKRPGERLQDEAPAGNVTVPAASIALRSTLPDNPDEYALRDQRASAARATTYAMAQPVGLGLVVASIVPAAIWGVAFVAARRKPSVRRSARQVRHEERTTLDAVRQMDVTTTEGRRDAFTQINVVVRDHLRDVVGIAGPSLTPREIGPALEEKNARVPAETVTSLLAACEHARYAPPDEMPSADACRQALEQAGEILAAR
jgi:hypothetical protein